MTLSRSVNPMQDLVFLVVTYAFFAVCVAYARKLDRI
jgi:hypothetical protein